MKNAMRLHVHVLCSLTFDSEEEKLTYLREVSFKFIQFSHLVQLSLMHYTSVDG